MSTADGALITTVENRQPCDWPGERRLVGRGRNLVASASLGDERARSNSTYRHQIAGPQPRSQGSRHRWPNHDRPRHQHTRRREHA